ncbi:hypothetical protein [Methylobacterium dankookense]|uniref:Uncharacterized protein n=1 Tax=Methylobacterium dankookense TaxID=560405 RepID=A0A564G7U6_9HYPH|nr:hypothetical protein [Methylobacterium dankookense]GJD59841.1 hypothetical protein IFDJLNFL_5772 [Methylobacterium dankookense]VUF16122.1 hypothetical protein MTDSW087_05879 [Methylobacterium dankookense]
MSLRLFGYACLAIIAGAIVSTALLIAWWAADRALPVRVHYSWLATENVTPGSYLHIRQEVEYVRDCRAHVDRVVYDSHTHRYFPEDIDYERPPQGLGTHVITFKIWVPEDFQPGPAFYRATPLYACNMLQRYYWPITRPDTVIEFDIVPKGVEAAQ